MKPDRFEELTNLMRGNIHAYIEFALDFALAGLFDEATELLKIGISEQNDKPVYPMAYYYKAWFESQEGNPADSLKTLKIAAGATSDYCFPNHNEAVTVLEWAKRQNPVDPKAPYYLGNFWYNALQYDQAIENWELSVNLDDQFPTAQRNLALACFNKLYEPQKALAFLDRAFDLDQSDSRILMELDQLYKRLNYLPEKRLKNLEKHLNLVEERDDLYLERATLYNELGLYDKAYQLIMNRKFHPWEGGEGKVTGQYVLSLIEMAKKAIEAKAYEKAIDLLNQARQYPENLGEGKLFGAQENEIFYWLGCAFEGAGMTDQAVECRHIASRGLKEPATAIFYNDQQADTIYFQGMALKHLNRIKEAKERFESLIRFGELHLNDAYKLDYFAVSLPDLLIWDDDLTKRNNENCQKLIRLGELGLSQL